MKNTYIMFVIALVVVGGGAFYSGMQYQSSKDAASLTAGGSAQGGAAAAGGAARRAGAAGARGGAAGANAGFVTGSVLSTDNQGLTVQMRDGSSKVVFVTPTTKVEKTVDGAIGDIAAQANVSITGSANADGSVTATVIQIRPAGMMPPFGQGSASSTNSASSTK